ncbi:MAG: chorismate-binding protein [Spirochaetes bacterium]|nr:chorismate-binding protein [Spirochaetota bacterium]
MFDLKNKEIQNSKIDVRKISADRLTPIKILTQMNVVSLLESAYIKTGKSRYSIMIIKEAFTIYKKSGKYILKDVNNKRFEVKVSKKGFLGILKEFRQRAPQIKELYEFPIPLGGLGFLGYEFFDEIEDINFKHKKDDRDIYESAFIFGRTFLIFDHLHDQVLLVAVQYNGEIQQIDLKDELDAIEKRLKEIMVEAYNDPIFETRTSKVVNNPYDKKAYIDKVNFIKNEIIKGNLFQCVPSRRIVVETDIPPTIAYRNLRMKNPSPYMLYLDFKDFVLFGASPEVMVKIKNGLVIVRPIAGTRKRGRTNEEDIALEKDLVNDKKEKAEHLMLLDLGRNDVGKVSVGGTVKVVEEMVVERYSNVMHLVSQVEGKLAPDKTSEDAIIATFPAGTVSGAPKIQAIKTIDHLEEQRRGPYAGLVGYFERNGDFDSCIVIRCCVFKNKKMFIQAGGGIVYDSDPEFEFQETENKAAALMIALGLKND